MGAVCTMPELRSERLLHAEAKVPDVLYHHSANGAISIPTLWDGLWEQSRHRNVIGGGESAKPDTSPSVPSS